MVSEGAPAIASLSGIVFRALGLPVMLLAAGCAAERPTDPFTATGELVALSGGDAGPGRACIACHGLQGQGDGELAPRLAGLPFGYLLKQMEDYADGRRAHPQMSEIAKALDARSRREVAAYYASLPVRAAPVPPAAAAPRIVALYHRGDPGRGLQACASCHGPAGEGVGPANPPLSGQPPGYLAAQFDRWRSSERRNDPQNLMLEIARRLSPEETTALSAYAAALSPASGAASAGPAASP